jgi:hypothetical protein
MIYFLIFWLIGSILCCTYWVKINNSYRRYRYISYNIKENIGLYGYILSVIGSWFSIWCIYDIYTDKMYHKYKSFKHPFRDKE